MSAANRTSRLSQITQYGAVALRASLTEPTLNAHCQPDGLRLSYLYRGSESFGWDMIDIAVSTDLEYQELQGL